MAYGDLGFVWLLCFGIENKKCCGKDKERFNKVKAKVQQLTRCPFGLSGV